MLEGTIARPKKRLFLALVLTSLAIIATIIYFAWKIMAPGLHDISIYLPWFVGGVVLIIVLGAVFSVACMILAVMGVPMFKVFRGMAWNIINLLFPIALFLGKIFNIEKDRIGRSFIELSNHLFKQKQIKVPANRVLLLLPHCLQLNTCPHKITTDVQNCRQCGGCCIGALLKICNKYGVHMTVVPGGTLARRVVISLRPKVVLAVACERDLTSGIQDVFPLPVFGVLNERPCGPCCNTVVDPELVEKAIREIIIEDIDEQENKPA